MCDFAPGDCVVCVDATPVDANGDPAPDLLKQGQCYTISECDYHIGLDSWGVLLSEVPIPAGYVSFRAHRFRRVYRPDGSLISKLLEPVDLGTEIDA